jgi:hypothetical protein
MGDEDVPVKDKKWFETRREKGRKIRGRKAQKPWLLEEVGMASRTVRFETNARPHTEDTGSSRRYQDSLKAVLDRCVPGRADRADPRLGGERMCARHPRSFYSPSWIV